MDPDPGRGILDEPLEYLAQYHGGLVEWATVSQNSSGM